MTNKDKVLLLSELTQALITLKTTTDRKQIPIAAQQLTNVLMRLGMAGQADKSAPVAVELPTSNDDSLAHSDIVDRDIAYVPEMITARQKANNAAIDLLSKIQDQALTRDNLTDGEIKTLASYTGNGGGLTSKEGVRGSAYEYYTPKAVADAMWSLAGEMGFKGGSVLDPSAGTGIFTATSPSNAVMNSIELDSVSGGIAQILNDGRRSKTVVSNFESQAKIMPDDSHDMIITNVPFGDNATRGANKNDDNCFKKESLENYFILRSLQKLKPGGLAIFVTPTSVVSGKAADKDRLRKATSLTAEFLGAWRMPTVVFKQTGANVVTDIVIYKKHSREAIDQIDDLYQAGEIDKLVETGVFWDEYLSGNYFKGSGKKFILGEVTTEESRYRKGQMVETVVSTKKTPEIMKMIRRFDGSRINWDALGAAEATYIEYKNGDVLFQDGRQLEYQDGNWRVMEKEVTDTDYEIQKLLGVMGSPIEMVVANITFSDIAKIIEYSHETQQINLIPDRVQKLIDRSIRVPEKIRGAAWSCVLAAQAIEDVIGEREYGYDFMSHEPALTKFMKFAFLDGKNSKLTGEAKQAHKFVAIHYANGKYSSAWRGDVDTTIDSNDGAKSYKDLVARMQYDNKSLYLQREQLALVNPDIDPLTDDEWFINHDGTQVIAANDFLTGNLASRLADIDVQIEKATDDNVLAKLRKQKLIAIDNVSRIDLQNVDFDLRTPLVGAEDKVRFLQQIGFKDAFVAIDKDGKSIADINVTGSGLGDYQKMANRIGDWMAKGTVTTGNVTLSKLTEREALDWLADQINTANIKFSGWVKASPSLMASLEAKMNADENLFFNQNSDESPIEIAGMNPNLKLHGYQNAEVRKQGRYFGGINGMGVGLGKTFTALASVKHTQNIGAKKKTIFVVPNSVLSNWRKEAMFAYQNTDDCLFIGLREKGDKFRVYSKYYDEDLLESINGKYTKIFMTFEAFKRIRLKDETVEKYAQYIKDNDAAFESKELQKEDEKSKGLVDDLINRIAISSSAPFLEDMRIDSVVIDEAHAFKNSIPAPNTGDRIKYLSKSTESGRGEGAQAKLFYIRGLTGNNDGVQLLTATPITNSPLEIYSMLSLAGGRDTVNKMCGGIKGADEFINIMCQVEEEVLPTIDGKTRSQNVFTGIRNAQILKGLIRSSAVIKDAKDVGLSVVIPDREEQATPVKLNAETEASLKQFQDAYVIARHIEKENLPPEYNDPSNPQSPFNPNSPYSLIAAKYGETNDLIAHPFNLIRKMDVMIADAEFSDMATFYDFDQAQTSLAQKAIDQFNKKAYKDERKRLSPYTQEGDYTTITKKENKETILIGYKVVVRASIILNNGRNRIMIDTLDGKIQSNFEDIADNDKLNLDVTVSAKVAAMLDNFKNEMANPRGINDDNTRSKIVKQIIFCDHLFLHNKIKRILAKRGGVKSGRIAIITGQVNNEPDEMIDIQDGFNASGDDNQYQVIIANKKAEVGINLQRGTQAIHHLTTGWTPDSLEQRNGRGARQGNKTEKVKIFHYDADGTFDEFKRTMINKKDEWITSVLTDDDKNTIDVSGSISRAEQDALIRLGGDAEAMRQYQITRDANEALARRETVSKRYKINMDVLNEQLRIAKHVRVDGYFDQAITDIVNAVRANNAHYKKAYSNSGSASTQANNLKRYNTTKEVVIGKIKIVLENIHFIGKDGKWEDIEGSEPFYPTVDPLYVYDVIEMDKRKDFAPGNSGSWSNVLSRDVLRKDCPYANARVNFEGGIYQAAYEDVYSTAQNLIKQSILEANSIADNAGEKSLKVPEDAATKLINDKATINSGIYYETNSFVIAKDLSTGDDGLFVIGDRIGYAFTIYKSTRRDNVSYYASQSNLSDLDTKLVILPSDPDYLKYVKKAAKIEDDLYKQGLLDRPVYSDKLPLVAEYRDTKAKPVYKLSDNLKQTQCRLSNCKISIMLPFITLSAGTPFSKAMIKSYEDAGITIDLTSRSFTVENDDVVVTNDYYNPSLQHDLYTAYVATEIENSGVKLQSDDTSIMRHPELISFLSKPVTSEIVNEIQSIADKVNNKLSYNDMQKIPLQIFDDHLFNNQYIDDGSIPNEIKLIALEYAYDSFTGKTDTFDILDFLYAAAKENATKSGQVKAEISDNDAVILGGYADRWKIKIMSYASQYGIELDAIDGRKYKYDGARKWWVTSYLVYKKIVADHPAAKADIHLEILK